MKIKKGDREAQAKFIAKLLLKYYPRGTTVEMIAKDGRQPWKHMNTIRLILAYMVREDIVQRVPLSKTGNILGAPSIYIVTEDYIPKDFACPTCGQVLEDQGI